jgi:small subunit ribosomal protein S20
LANTKSAKKRVRSNERKRQYNRPHITRAKNAVKKARHAIESGDQDAASMAVSDAYRWLDHAASKGVIHKNNASRRKGRLAKALAQMSE